MQIKSAQYIACQIDLVKIIEQKKFFKLKHLKAHLSKAEEENYKDMGLFRDELVVKALERNGAIDEFAIYNNVKRVALETINAEDLDDNIRFKYVNKFFDYWHKDKDTNTYEIEANTNAILEVKGYLNESNRKLKMDEDTNTI